MIQEMKKRAVVNYIKSNTKNQIIIRALSGVMSKELPTGMKFTRLVLAAMPEPAPDPENNMFFVETPEAEARREMLALELKIDRLTGGQTQMEVLDE